MWFIGLVVGAIIGAIGNGEGALIGAIVGAIIGAAISSQRRSARDERLQAIEEAISTLNRRVDALEGLPRAATAVDPAAATPAPWAAPEPERPALTPADAMALEAAGASARIEQVP